MWVIRGRFVEPEVSSCRLLRMPSGFYVRSGLPHPRRGDGAGCRLVTMDTAFDGMPDVGWLRQSLPGATIAFRSNNRDVQARLCAAGTEIGRASCRERVCQYV